MKEVIGVRAEHWQAVTALAAEQHQVITTSQLQAMGCPERTRKRALAAGLLVLVRRGVYALPGATSDPLLALMAACLAAGGEAVASHLAAAWVWGFDRVLPGTLEVTNLAGGRRQLQGVRVHRTGVLLGEDRDVRFGVPVTSPARTAIDLASCLSMTQLGHFLNHLTRQHLCTIEDVRRHLQELGGRGRAGTRMLRVLVAERVEGLEPGDSDAEVRLVRQLVRLGVPRPVQCHQVVVGARVFLLDLAWPHLLLAVELDGFGPHSSRTAFDHDRERDLLLKRAGWEVIRVTTNTDVALLADLILRRHASSGV